VQEQDPEAAEGEGPQRGPDPVPSRILNKKLTYLVAGIFVLLITVFGEDSRRTVAAEFIENDVREPVRALSPFSMVDVFFDSARGCEVSLIGCEPQSLLEMMPRFPQAFIEVGKHIVSQGIAGVLLLGFPFLLIGVSFIVGAKDDNPLIMLHPGFWALMLLCIAVFAWVMQFATLLLLFVVKQTILACGILAFAYLVYERFELWHKARNWLEVMLSRH
jgi:hypothetical protein